MSTSSRVASQPYTPRHSPFSDPSPFQDAEEINTTTTIPKITNSKSIYSNISSTSTANNNVSTSTNNSNINKSNVVNTTPRIGSGLSNQVDRNARETKVAPNSLSLDKSISKSTNSSPNKLDNKIRGEKDKVSSPSKGKNNSKKGEVPFDVIDRLDISGLYGGGSFHRHDGPYAAASRTKSSRAPIGAFSPSALALPSASSLRPPPSRSQSSTGLSPRAAATLYAMENDRNIGGTDDVNGPYGVRKPLGQRRVSESSVSMGFPSSKAEEGSKGQQLIEIYGVRENEAWEDFAVRYAGGGESHASSKDSIDGKASIGTAQSIWDIEATLRAGRPVAQAPPPLPIPILTSDPSTAFSDSLPYNSNSSNKPKRSKSLAARFRAGRKNPNNPMTDDVSEEVSSPTVPNSSNTHSKSGVFDGREAGKSDFGNGGEYSMLNSSIPASSGAVRFESNKVQTSTIDQEKEKEVLQEERGGIRFVDNGLAGSSPMSSSRSLGIEDERKLAGASQLGRKKSVIQRIFGSRS